MISHPDCEGIRCLDDDIMVMGCSACHSPRIPTSLRVDMPDGLFCPTACLKEDEPTL
jgi:hypothetical protein